jgi:hypothetical protein
MNKNIILIIELIAVILGIFTITTIIPDKELLIGIFSLTFGILAIIWSVIAISSLSKGTSIRNYVVYILIGTIALVLSTVFQSLSIFFKWEGITKYLEYIFMSIAYILFVIASYSVFKLSKEFGFKEKAKEISKRLKR